MSQALTTLPWVESDTIKADGKKRQVKFTLKSGAKINMDELKEALGPRYSDGVKVLTAPTDK